MIANVAVLVLQVISPKVLVPVTSAEVGVPADLVTAWFAAWPERFWSTGTIWQPFTYMFLHAGLMHIAFNMLALWMFGSPLALLWGEKKFLRFYLLCGFGAGLIIVTWPALVALFGTGALGSYLLPTLGASGAVFGVLLGYSLTWPDRTIMLLFPPIPIKAIYFIPVIFFMSLLGPQNVSHVGHLGGILVGWILLRRMGTTGGITFKSLQYRWRRYKMRRNLRAVRMEELRSRRRQDDDHGPYH
jgi:membrane associated rhomboid family serine protease